MKTAEAAHSGIVIILSEWSAHEKFNGGDLLKWVWGVKCWILNLYNYSKLKFLMLKAGLSYCCAFSKVVEDLKNYISHPVLYQEDQETGSQVLRICRLSFLQELAGRNNLLKLLSPHPFDMFYLFRYNYSLSTVS